MLVDHHCHLTDGRFAGEVEDVLGRARDAGVTGIVTVGTDGEDSRAAASLADAHPDVWSTAGIHPHAAGEARPGELDDVAELAARDRVVAVGETGLDYHYENAPREVQRRWFRRHLELAAELGLPAVVHSRDADADTAAALRELPAGTRGVLHCFTGGRELLETALDAGWHIGFTGIVSFASYDGEDLVRAVPDDRLLVETDAPYLAPVPRRGRRNEPAYVVHVRDAVAGIRGESPDEVGRKSAENAARLYGVGGIERA